jgi:hypothetical protein
VNRLWSALLVIVPALAALPSSAQQFERVFSSAITDAKGASSGVSWGDYNADGWEDLVVTNWLGQKNTLIANLGKGEFKWIEEAFPFNDTGESVGSRWFDTENDGDLDLLVTNLAGPTFYYQNEGGELLKITDNGLVSDNDNYRFAGIADYDNDSDLDVFYSTPDEFVNVLMRNNGPGSAFKSFQDGVIVKEIGDSACVCWGDPDDDGDQDLFVGNINRQTDFFYWNVGNLQFEKEDESALVTTIGYSLSCNWIDVDNDGDLDLFTTDQTGSNHLFVNEGAARFAQVFNDALVSDQIGGYGSAWADVENDGDLDVFVANRDGNSTLYVNDGAGRFEPALKEPPSLDQGASISGAWADYDRDGYLDLFVANDGEPNFLYHNTGGDNGWINLRLVGDVSNAWGIGAKVLVIATIGGKTVEQRRDVASGSSYSQNSLRVHVGLGDAKLIETLVVEWPSGIVNKYANVPINQFVDVVEGDDTPLPVSLVSFEAVADGSAIVVRWTTASERNNAGFEVQLGGARGFAPAGFVAGAGTTETPRAYTHRIDGLAPGSYRVRLKQIDFDGAFAYSPTRTVRLDAREALRVEPAYPNPFNPSATVRFVVREAGPVQVALFDAAGRMRRVLFEGDVPASEQQEVTIDGAELPSGPYFVRIAGAGRIATTPVLLLK